MGSHRSARGVRSIGASVVLSLSIVGSAGAQTSADPNPGALTFTGGLDVPTLYYFRGIRQETDPQMTLWPSGDVGIAIASGDGSVKSAVINFGVWNSLHTGTSGTGGVSGKLHYEEDFYTALNLGLGKGVGLGTTFTAYTSPNNMFTTVKEISVKFSHADKLSPYSIVAFEIGGSSSGQADGGQFFGGKKGTYLELGVGPSWPLGGKATVTVPVKLGMSLNNYYEMSDGSGDNKFGFFDVGASIAFPLNKVSSQFGTWNLHGGVDFFSFGDTLEAINVNKDGETSSTAVTAMFGIGVSY